MTLPPLSLWAWGNTRCSRYQLLSKVLLSRGNGNIVASNKVVHRVWHA